jgi:hypothetical protein
MRQRRSQHLRLAFSAGRGRGAQVDARLLNELRDRRDPSPDACTIGAEIARAIGAVIARAAVSGAGERCGPDAQAGGSKSAGVMFQNAAKSCLVDARLCDELRDRRDPTPGAHPASRDQR